MFGISNSFSFNSFSENSFFASLNKWGSRLPYPATILGKISILTLCAYKFTSIHPTKIYNSRLSFLVGKIYFCINIIFAFFSKASAQRNLGYMYLEGLGVQKDVKSSLAYYKKAIDQNFVYAQVELGNFYKDGTDIGKDLTKAKEYYILAATQGNIEAQNSLVNFYLQEDGKERKDLVISNEFNPKETNQVHVAEVQYVLGYMFQRGVGGVEKDLVQARKCYQKGADLGHADAQFKFAYMCEKGWGGVRDLEKATNYYQKAATQNHKEAQKKLRFIEKELEQGNQKLEELKKLIGEAFKGDAKAQFKVALIYERGNIVPQNLNQAVMFYESAAAQKHAESNYRLGRMYECGWGVKKNITKALKLYELAKDQGCEDAIKQIQKIKKNHEEYQRQNDYFEKVADNTVSEILSAKATNFSKSEMLGTMQNLFSSTEGKII